MKRFALIGKHLGHSWSQQWFEDHFLRLGLTDYTYELHEMPTLDGLRQWIEGEGIAGFNVTIPYKQSILPHLDALSPDAEVIGAVNCVAVEKGRLIGYNTDAPAFLQTLMAALQACSLPSTVRRALVLGTGGAARAVTYALQQTGTDVRLASRRPQGTHHLAYSDIPVWPADILVNATPVGMFPDVDVTPLDLMALVRQHPNAAPRLVYDLIYNPSPTLLMRQADAMGIPICDGLPMLKRQAELSWERWNSLETRK